MNDYHRASRMVSQIDTEAITPLLKEVHRAIYGTDVEDLYVLDQVLIEVLDDEGYPDHAVVMTEGVGHHTGPGNTLGIYCQAGRSVHLFALPLYVKRIPVKDDQVDFAEFVRTFGGRLDANWSMWEGRMAKAESKKVLAK